MNQFDYMQAHPEFLTEFQNAFRHFTPQFATAMLSKYHGFASVHTLVDVGGSSGMILSYIVQKYPHIRGINFDLPEVVAKNPSFPGKQLTPLTYLKIPDNLRISANRNSHTSSDVLQLRN
jgi:caffeic acid 3-O-methyltransferase